MSQWTRDKAYGRRGGRVVAWDNDTPVYKGSNPLAGKVCTCPPNCIVADGPRECPPTCEACAIVLGREASSGATTEQAQALEAKRAAGGDKVSESARALEADRPQAVERAPRAADRAAAAVGASGSLGTPVFAIHYLVDGRCSCRKKNCGKNAGKHPATRNGFYDATSDPEAITRMWGSRPYNVGVPTGIAFDVLDIDHTNLAVGIADLPECVAELVETAPMVRSGSGKVHVYFEPTGLGRHIRFSKHCDWLGTDGYAIIPPSITNGVYTWVRPIDGPLPKVPVELLDMIRKPPDRRERRTTSRPIGEQLDETSFYGLYGRLAVAQDGTRNDVLNWAAHKIGFDVHDRKATSDQGDAACEQLEHVALLIGLEPDEIESTIMSGYSAGVAGRRKPRTP